MPPALPPAMTETLFRTCTNPLFRAAGVDPNPARIVPIRHAAIAAFGSTGNRMLRPRQKGPTA